MHCLGDEVEVAPAVASLTTAASAWGGEKTFGEGEKVREGQLHCGIVFSRRGLFEAAERGPATFNKQLPEGFRVNLQLMVPLYVDKKLSSSQAISP